MTQFDWLKLAHIVGAFSSSHGVESYSSDMAPVALDQLLGSDMLHDAVECCLNLRPGWGIAELILRQLESPTAMEYCSTIYLTSDDTDRRRAAAWLLGTIGNRRAASSIAPFLADPQPGVQQAGMKLLRRWMHDNMENTAMLALLSQAEQHENPTIRAEAEYMRRFIAYATTFDQQFKSQK
ncbi:MAG: HEAT repeat domain-containing protein [Chloroflexaceae bacterium]|jgi:HEAT repeat protein|nr:HEAT repeat domain-containing protein [Chloroflexaceae bacterium]